MPRAFKAFLIIAASGLAACHQSTARLARPSPEPDPSVATGDSAQPKARQVEEMLEGRFAGVEVFRTKSGGLVVNIRGSTSLIGSSQPLYVVNGLAVEVDPDRGLDWLSPSDIKRIEVVKDPAELAFYGVRGGNGVIRITTKGHD